MKEIAFDQDKYYPAVEPKPAAMGEEIYKLQTGMLSRTRLTFSDRVEFFERITGWVVKFRLINIPVCKSNFI